MLYISLNLEYPLIILASLSTIIRSLSSAHGLIPFIFTRAGRASALATRGIICFNPSLFATNSILLKYYHAISLLLRQFWKSGYLP